MMNPKIFRSFNQIFSQFTRIFSQRRTAHSILLSIFFISILLTAGLSHPQAAKAQWWLRFWDNPALSLIRFDNSTNPLRRNGTASEGIYTPGAGYQSLTPTNITSYKGASIGAPAAGGDTIEYNSGSEIYYPDSIIDENIDWNQGSAEFWGQILWDGDDGLFHYLLDVNSGSNTNRIMLVKDDNDDLLFRIYDADSVAHDVTYDVSSAWSANDWVHVVATWDLNANTMALYTDGTVRDNTPNPVLSADTFSSVPANYTFGMLANTYNHQFHGTIAGRILNRVLSSAEVTVLYNSGNGSLDTFVALPETVCYPIFTDEITDNLSWHRGQEVTATTTTSVTVAEAVETRSWTDNDRIIVADGTGYKLECYINDASIGTSDTSFNVDDGAGGAVTNLDRVGVNIDCDNTYYAEAANNTIHDLTTEDLCFSAWVKVDRNAGSVFTVQMKANSLTGAVGYDVYCFNGTVKMVIHDGTDSYIITGNTDIRDNKWHHIAAIIDRDTAANCKIFLDGYEDGSTGKAGTLADVDSISSAQIFSLGRYIPAVQWYLDGQIRDVKLYYASGSIWSDAQVLYQATHPFDYGASAGTMTDYWECDENTGTTLTGNANNLTLSNASAWSKEAFVSKNLMGDAGLENGGIGGWVEVGSLTTFAKDTVAKNFNRRSINLIADASGEGISQVISASSGEDYLLNLWYYVFVGSFEIDVTNGGGNLKTGISDSSWTEFQSCLEATGNLTVQFLSEAASDDVNIDQIILLKNFVDNGGLEGTYDDESAGGGGTVDVAPGWNKYQVETDGTDTLDESADEHTGAKAQQINVDATDEGITQAVSFVADKYYTVACWIKRSSGIAKIEVGDDSGTWDSDTETSATYAKCAVTFQADSSISNGFVRVVSSGGASNFLVDDVSIIQLDQIPASTESLAGGGGAGYVTGKWSEASGALDLSGGDSLYYPTANNLKSKMGAFSCFFKPSWDGDDGNDHYFLNTQADEMILYKTSADKIRFYPNFTDNSGRYVESTSALTGSDITSGSWHHLAVIWNQPGDWARIYLDGTLHTTTSTGTTWTLPTFGTNFYVGSDDASTSQVEANLDSVFVFQRVLTQGDIYRIYRSTRQPRFTELVRWLWF